VDGGESRDVSIVEAVAVTGGRAGQHAHAGDEHHLVLSGRWRMAQGDHVVELSPGDYFRWDGSNPHDAEAICPDEGRIQIITFARR
jgi:mannose-6-phosphate isomerase-like protein (cupin superfamily)